MTKGDKEAINALANRERSGGMGKMESAMFGGKPITPRREKKALPYSRAIRRW